MKSAELPFNEDMRLESLRRMQLLSTPAEADFDRVTRTAADHFDIPIVLVSLIDQNRQWFKSRHGLEVCETSRDVSFCAHAILGEDILVIADTRADERFADNPLVTGEPHVGSYAGLPVTNGEGFKVGTLCLIDHHPRQFTPGDTARLQDFGRWLQLVFENRDLGESQMALLAELGESRRDALIDPLTQVWNRRGFSSLMSRELAKAARERAPAALVMIDIDHFKKINDDWGHPVGDQALVLLVQVLRQQLRSYDVLARLGGEEFGVILSGGDRESVGRIAEKLRAAVEAGAVLPNGARFTISLGTAWSDGTEAGLDEAALVARADKALYAAKAGGRNRVVAAERLAMPASGD